jgi:hypothetical protein
MKTGFWGSILVVATLGFASVASAEPAAAKTGKGAAPKAEKNTKAPPKDDSLKDQPVASAETKTEPPAAPAPSPQPSPTTEPAERKVSPFGPPSTGPKVSPFGAPASTPQVPPSAEAPLSPPAPGPPRGGGRPTLLWLSPARLWLSAARLRLSPAHGRGSPVLPLPSAHWM